MDDHFERLPVEVQERIFDYLSEKADLLECQLTCKLWNKHSTRALYKSVTFDHRDIGKANGYKETLTKYGKDLMNLVEHVKIFPFPNFENQHNILLKFFLDNCPNIRTFLCRIKDESYLESLNTKNWKHLEKFFLIYSNKSKQVIEIAKEHKGTIKVLILHESIMPNFCDIKPDIKEKLAEFKSLEDITIILEQFHHLSSLDNLIPENVKSLKLDLEELMFGQELIDNQETVIPQDIDLRKINPCPNIKELMLGMPLNDENSFKYLMHKFPKLEKLYYGSEEVISVSKDTREAITGYLLNIKNAIFRYTLVCDSDSPMDYFIVKKLIESSKTKDSRKKRVFAVILSTEEAYMDIILVRKKTNNVVESYQIILGLDKLQKLDFLKRFGTDLTKLDVWKIEDDRLNFSEILMHCPNLNSLELVGFDYNLDEELKGSTMNLKALEYVDSERFTPEVLSKRSKYFPNLTDLIFSGSVGTVIDFSSIATTFPSLVSLEMSNIEILLSNTNKKNYTVKKLGLNNCKLPSGDFFPDLSSYLPNVCELELRIPTDDSKSKEFILDMPETSFQSLFIRASYLRDSPLTALLKISLPINDEETDNKKRYYVSTNYYKNVMKKCTEADYESYISESTEAEHEPFISESTGAEYESVTYKSIEAEYESVFFERTENLGSFQITVNCKKFPRIVERMGPYYIANVCGIKHDLFNM